MMNGTFTGLVDRIVDGETAVILIEDDGDVIEQFDVPVDRLPESSRHGGEVLSVTVENDEFVSAEHRDEETQERRDSVRERLDRLSKKLSDLD